MDEATKAKVLAAKTAREAKQRAAVAAIKRLRTAPLKETLTPDREPSDNGGADAASDEDTKDEDGEQPTHRTLAEHVNEFLDEYIKAVKEIEQAENRLIELRGGEANLTEDDRDALQNVADLVKARYERMLDI